MKKKELNEKELKKVSGGLPDTGGSDGTKYKVGDTGIFKKGKISCRAVVTKAEKRYKYYLGFIKVFEGQFFDFKNLETGKEYKDLKPIEFGFTKD